MMLKYQVPNKHSGTAALIHFPPNSSCPQTFSVLTVGQGQYYKLVTARGFLTRTVEMARLSHDAAWLNKI
jgi:hypothetical protein